MIHQTQQKIAELIIEVLEVDPDQIDEETHFGEYGFESVTMAELAARINHEFGVNLNAAYLYEYNTLKDLSEKIYEFIDTGHFAPVDDVMFDAPQNLASKTGKEDKLLNLQAELIHMVSEIIDLPEGEFQIDDYFGELGYESVSLGELSERISNTYGVNITPTVLYERNNIRELALYLQSLLAGSQGERQDNEKDRIILGHETKVVKPNEKSVSAMKSTQIADEVRTDIAIVGMAGIFPQSENLTEFWAHLLKGDCVIGPIPQERMELAQWREELKTMNPLAPEPRGGFMKEVDKFDPSFFNISPKEAELMDPQQRKLLETVWNALEDAGYAKSSLAGSKTGVFVGVSSNDYTDILMNQGIDVNAFTATGKAYSILANRISYFFDLHGPSQAVDTACSSSLVALHHAVESLQGGGCDLAIAGGVNILLSPVYYQAFMDAGMLSPSGCCRTFDKDADGYVRGEGIAVLVLKPLSKAIQDGNQIYGIIKASHLNHGGRAHSLTAPNPDAQAELLVEAYRKAGLDPATVGYIEAHGTGTKLGDPIEIQALKKAFNVLYRDWGYSETGRKHCVIGSVKTNIGHLEAAAGIAGIIKVLLAMKYRAIPGTVNFNELNPYIDLEKTPFFIIDKTRIWEKFRDQKGLISPRRAGVSSFGFGGANAHVVLEEYCEPGIETSGDSLPATPYIIVLSAKNKERLMEYTKRFAAFLDSDLGSPEEIITVDEDHDFIRNTILSVITDLLQIKRHEINVSDNLYEHGMDQYSFSQMYQQLCDKLKIEFSIGEILKLQSVNEIINFTQKKMKTGNETVSFKIGAGERILTRRTKESIQFASLKNKHDAVTLSDMAYTLQTGREAMEERLALVVNSLEELQVAFDSLLYGHEPECPYFYGNVPAGKEAGFLDHEKVQEDIRMLYTNGKVGMLAKLWVEGVCIDWERLYGPKRPKLIPLPTYPFAAERYWLAENEAKAGESNFIHPLAPPNALAPPNPATLLLKPVWKTRAAVGEASFPEYIRHLVVLCETMDIFREIIENRFHGVRCLTFQSNEKDISQRFLTYATRLFEEIQSIIKEKPAGRVLVQILVARQGEQQLFSGLAGVLKTARQEYPKLIGQLIEVESGENSDGIVLKLEENAKHPEDNQIRYLVGDRMVAAWSEMDVSPEKAAVPWRQRGTYLITGGAGSLGLLIAKEIINQVNDTNLILIGRSPLTTEKQAQLENLKAKDVRLQYKAVDVNDKKAVIHLMQSIRKEFGGLDGIIHCAGIIRDNFIVKKNREEFIEVMTPKVTGLVNLDEASQDMPLDFFILFSSIAGALGNQGQADYSAANAFLDQYTMFRNGLTALNQRHGHTLAVNWPLWKEGGMHIDEEYEKTIYRTTGMTAMETRSGIKALYHCYASGQDQVMVMEGNLSQIRDYIFKSQSQTATVKAEAQVDPQLLREKTFAQLKALFGGIIKMAIHKIDITEPLEHYGINSLIITHLNRKLAAVFTDLSKTLFFEYRTLEAVANYLMTQHQEECVRWTGLSDRFRIIPEVLSVGTVTNDEAQANNPVRTETKNFIRAPRTTDDHPREPIAIIGMNGMYPGANNLADFWINLKAGRDCITEIPEERWPLEGFFDPDPGKAAAHGKSYSKWGGFLDGFTDFDPLFFNISPREAMNMDPQERLFIKACWHVLEDAGYTREQIGSEYQGRVGVFAGITKTGYNLYGPDLWKQGESLFPLTSFGSVANRVSYLLNFKGPSMPVDTMCSSSLTAIHEACEHLYRGECELALAGGVNLYLHPSSYIHLCGQKMLSVEGRCKSFGQGGNGFVPGEGVGVVLLKPLSRALKDHDHIYALIRGTGINHDGKTNGYTVPNPTAQKELIEAVLEKAGVNARTVSYIEAHGTGTELGDPIEITGLTQAFQKDTRDTGFCAVGSVKSNIGHLEAAAGIAGITKIVLQMIHRQIAPSLHAKETNPNIDFGKTPFALSQELTEWKRPKVYQNGINREFPRIAGISSFGAGGSNAHVIIEEYVAEDWETVANQITDETGSVPAIIVLSAKNEERLKEQARQLLAVIHKQKDLGEETPAISLQNIAYTLQVGREAMEERLGFITTSINDLEGKLKAFIEGEAFVSGLYLGQVKRNKETIAVLTNDEDMQETAVKWIQRQKYGKLLELWVKGFHFDWNRIYDAAKPYRISLPPYPFAQEKYWIPEIYWAFQCKGNTTSVMTESSFERRKRCFLAKQWEPVNAVSSQMPIQKIAILAMDETNQLAILLSQHFPGSRILNIQDQKSGEILSGDDWRNFNCWVDLIGCGTANSESMDWIIWLQRFIERDEQTDLMLICVTKGLESFFNPDINLAGASRTGLYRMLQNEYSHLRSKHMDVEKSIDDAELSRLIATEFQLESEEAEICYRHGFRYRAVLKESKAFYDAVRTINFSENQVLWITGGTRGLGYLCAQHFVTKYGAKRLVLTGREVLPSREQWESNISQNTATAQKIRAIRALEDQGVQVKVLTVDLTNRSAVQKSLDEIKETMGEISGIIHCAGINDDENPAFVRKTLSGIRRVLSPKFSGLNILYETLKNEPLQFFIAFSSVAGMIPTLAVGQSDYAMANAYMDYFAEAHGHSGPVISIQWPSWKDTGMGEVKSAAFRQTGFLSLTNTEGLEMLDRILHCKMGPVVLPAMVNPEIWRPDQLMQRTLSKTFTTNIQKYQPAATAGVTTPVEITAAVENWLIGIFADELRIHPEKFEVNTAFQEFGLDSIYLAQIIKRMDRELAKVSIEPSAILEYPNIKNLAGYLVQTYPEAIAALFSYQAKLPLTGDQFAAATGQTTSPSYEFPAGQPAGSQEVTVSVYPDKIPGKIAVVGMACHFPDAANIEEYWENLITGRDSIREVPKTRWDWRKNYRPEFGEGKIISKWGAFLTAIEEFDPGFFKIPESLAAQIDPLQRQWLEVCAEALADAGYSKKDLWGKRVGVFVGARTGNFFQKVGRIQSDTIIGTGQNFITAHLAHIYNFKGPNMVVDTACSSSLTAIHLAVKSIQSGEAELALAGGVDILNESIYSILSSSKILSPDGRCKTFDSAANGIGVGEGGGVLILKPLAKAIRDGDKIYGVIDGSAVNCDGNTMGVTTPNPEAQRELIEATIAVAGINPKTISYVETHGTGTLIGDPIELKALTQVLTGYTHEKQFCGVGSVKSNIGHLLSAAGAAGIIKVLLAITNRQLPPTLHCNQPNPRFNFQESPFYVVQEAMKWSPDTIVLRAGISAFGLGGNNAHIIISNEGIPETSLATLSPRGERIVFQRKRYWPEQIEPQFRAINWDQPAMADEDEEFLEYLAPVKV